MCSLLSLLLYFFFFSYKWFFKSFVCRHACDGVNTTFEDATSKTLNIKTQLQNFYSKWIQKATTSWRSKKITLFFCALYVYNGTHNHEHEWIAFTHLLLLFYILYRIIIILIDRIRKFFNCFALHTKQKQNTMEMWNNYEFKKSEQKKKHILCDGF